MRPGKADQVTLAALIKDCATLKVEADGLTLFAGSVVAEGRASARVATDSRRRH
jgi:hypothetical protein